MFTLPYLPNKSWAALAPLVSGQTCSQSKAWCSESRTYPGGRRQGKDDRSWGHASARAHLGQVRGLAGAERTQLPVAGSQQGKQETPELGPLFLDSR